MAQETTKKQSRTAVPAPLSRENLLKNHMQDKPWPWFYSFLKKYLPVMIPGLFMVVIASAIAIFNPPDRTYGAARCFPFFLHDALRVLLAKYFVCDAGGRISSADARGFQFLQQ